VYFTVIRIFDLIPPGAGLRMSLTVRRKRACLFNKLIRVCGSLPLVGDVAYKFHHGARRRWNLVGGLTDQGFEPPTARHFDGTVGAASEMRSYEARSQVHEPLHPLHREAFSARPNPGPEL
jgi:hypothetical protein